jgi:ABC-type multidrug transport system ATPase subunit
MDEAGLCDRVALVQSGRLLSVDTPVGVTDSFGKPLIAARGANMLELLNLLKQHENVDDAYPFGEFHHVVLKNEDHTSLENFLQAKGQKIELKKIEPDIEDCFIALMKN